MTVVELIERKRNGGRLTSAELKTLMAEYAADRVPEYQMSALAMAIYFRGLDAEETEALTAAMLESGSQLDLRHLAQPRVDKHSTGGVGDKVSIILAPLVAACGVAVPMMSGRGLGHTGGTLDKLESIPGFNTRLTLAETVSQMEQLGVALIGQTAEIAPADRKFYALRDATATVEAIPLICASIMSKKLAEGLNGLVLDVKTGAGAFMTKLEDSIALAKAMIAAGELRGCTTVALLTDMDSPLGEACGNAVEIVESVEALKGRGPRDLMEVTMALSVEMLLVAGVAKDAGAAKALLEKTLASGAALEKFRAIVSAQGGDPRVCDDPVDVLPKAPVIAKVLAERDGIVQRVEPRAIGRAIIHLGGGRTKVTDDVDPAVGLYVHVRPGARVTKGQPIATVHARTRGAFAETEKAVRAAVTLGDASVTPRVLVSHRISAAGVDVL